MCTNRFDDRDTLPDWCEGTTLRPTPSPSLSLSPSVAPTSHPSADGCLDSPLRFEFTKYNGSIKFVTCDYIRKNVYRCKQPGVSQMCPSTCSSTYCSCVDSSLRFKVETPKGKVVEKTCGGDWINVWKCNNYKGLARSCQGSCGDEFCGNPICRDFPNEFKVEISIYTSRWIHCEYLYVGSYYCGLPGVAEICPESCGTCSNCEDTSTKFKIRKADGNIVKKTCNWANSWRCDKIEGLKQACRKKCGHCS